MSNTKGNTTIAKNRKAYHDFHVLEKYEAGIELKGTEVKSIRDGKIQLKEGFARIIKDELILFNVHIGAYSHGNINNHEPLRERRLLMHRKEINKFIGKMHKSGLTLVPLSMYFKGGRVKVEIGLCKGKKEFDKRESIKKRDIEREEARHDIRM